MVTPGRSVRAMHGDASPRCGTVQVLKTIWFTETGAGTGGDMLSEARRRQANELPKRIAFARASGAEGFTWFALQFSREFGMITRGGDPMPYPQVAAYNELTKLMRGRTFVQQHDVSSGVWVLEFAGKDDRTLGRRCRGGWTNCDL